MHISDTLGGWGLLCFEHATFLLVVTVNETISLAHAYPLFAGRHQHLTSSLPAGHILVHSGNIIDSSYHHYQVQTDFYWAFSLSQMPATHSTIDTRNRGHPNLTSSLLIPASELALDHGLEREIQREFLAGEVTTTPLIAIHMTVLLIAS